MNIIVRILVIPNAKNKDANKPSHACSQISTLAVAAEIIRCIFDDNSKIIFVKSS